MDELQTFEIDPQSGARASVIWLHGLGASNHDFDDLVPLLDAPNVRFVFPNAPRRAVTINGGAVMPAWYDLLSLQENAKREDAATVRDAERLVTKLVQREIARGIAAERIALLGFSQGGAMALHVGARFPERLAGIGVLSGYLLLQSEFEAERNSANNATPLLFCHGKFDPVVPFGLGKRAFDQTQALGHPGEWHSFPMQHSMCLEEVDVLKDWLTRCGVRQAAPV
jgi:phospholipase/carboxylesterase